MLYLLWAAEEGEAGLLAVGPDGRVRWKQHLPGSAAATPFPIFGSRTALVTDGRYVYIAMESTSQFGDFLNVPRRRTAIWRVKASNGEYAPFGDPYEASAALYPGSPHPVGRTHIFLDTIRREGSRQPLTTYEANVRGLAASPDHKLYVSLYFEDRIAVYEDESGRLLSTLDNVRKPLGIEYRDGFLYVVSEGRVLRLSADGRERGVAIERDLEAPYTVALDGSGRIYVADLGSSQQVKKFSSDGRLLRSYGVRGGRGWQSRLVS